MTKVRQGTQNSSIDKAQLEAEVSEALQTSLKMHPPQISQSMGEEISSKPSPVHGAKPKAPNPSENMDAVPSPS